MNKIKNKENDFFYTLVAIALITILLLQTAGDVNKLSIVVAVLTSLFLLTLLLKKAEHYAYYILIPLVPFSQSVPVLSLGSRSVNLGMDTIFISILILWHIFTNKKKLNLYHKYNRSSLILVCWLIWNFITILISSLYLTFNQVAENFIVLLRWGQYVPIFIILANGKLNYYQSKKAILILCFSGVMAAGLGFYQIYDGLNPLYFKGAPSFTAPLFREADPSEFVDENGNYMGSANYNVVGAYLIITTLLSISYVLSSFSRYVRIIGSLAILIMIGGIVITFSRSSFIALILSMLFLIYKYSKKKFIYSIGIALCALIFSFIAFRQFPLIADLTETALNIFTVIPRVLAGDQWSSGSDVSSQVYGAALRVVGMRDSFYIFANNPLIGYGFNAYQYFGLNNTPDNYILQTLAETGIVGFILMFLFFKLLVGLSVNSNKPDICIFVANSQKALLSILLAMIIVNSTGGIFYIQKVWGAFLMVCGILLAMVNDSKIMSNCRPPAKLP